MIFTVVPERGGGSTGGMMPEKLRDSFMVAYGMIGGVWIGFVGHLTGSVLLAAIATTAVAGGGMIWEFRKSVREAGAGGSVEPPPVNAKGS